MGWVVMTLIYAFIKFIYYKFMIGIYKILIFFERGRINALETDIKNKRRKE